MENNGILIGGSVGDSDSLFFLEINAQLDSINSQFYSSDLDDIDEYQLTGLSYDEATSKIFFSGSESTSSSNEFTLFGQMNAQNLIVEETYRSSKAKALPATPILLNANGGLLWAYNSGSSVLAGSNNRDMRQLEDIEYLEFDNVVTSSIETKELYMSMSGDIILFGELRMQGQNQATDLFLYNATIKDKPVIFSESGSNQLNGVKQLENGYLIAGSTEISEVGSNTQSDFLISRRNINGGGFTKTFGSGEDEQLHDAVMVNDKIYAIGSTFIGIDNTLLLIKTNKLGELEN
jgi:hypothetical protein